MNKLGKGLLIGFGSLVVVAGVALTVLDNIGVTYALKTEVKDIQTNVKIVENQKYTTIAKYNKDGSISDEDFKVMCFTDLHLDHKQELCDYTFNMMVRNIVNEKPDYVVFLGDNLTSALNKPRTVQFAETLEDLGVYWSMVLGNHEHSADNPFCITRSRMMNMLAKYDHCLIDPSTKKTSSGERVWGNGNYVVNIANSKGISQSLFFLDSGTDMSKSDQKKYADELAVSGTNRTDDYIKESQVTWYSETLKDILSTNPGTKSTLFFHIPLMEYYTAYTTFTGETDKINPFNDTISYTTVESGQDGMISGLRRETICYSGHNSGLFAEAKKIGSTQAMFSGHDHSNNFVLRYQGIILGCCQTSGYSSNNVWTKGISEHLLEGYSLYTFSKDGSIKIEEKVNETIWGNDLYKEVIALLVDSRGEYVDKSANYK